MRLEWGTVLRVVSTDAGAQTLAVTLDTSGASSRAICLPRLSGACDEGDRVLLNTTAVELGLGTGGAHFVVARTGAVERPSGVVLDDPSGGRIMKLRYTPMQIDVASAEELDSGAHPALEDADDLGGMPVVCCGLHSQVPLVAAGIRENAPDARIAYVMTDAAALPLAVSQLVGTSREAGLLDTVVTTGQAFGGDLEAVTLHAGLLAARLVARADVAVVGIGPGIVGTATAFGHGGVAQGEAINAVSVIGGMPIAVLRLSFADARLRHQGVSHHTLTALSRVALAQAMVAVPVLGSAEAERVDSALEQAGVWQRHARHDVTADPCLARDRFGLDVTTMGRTIDDDPAFFAAGVAAGILAAEFLAL